MLYDNVQQCTSAEWPDVTLGLLFACMLHVKHTLKNNSQTTHQLPSDLNSNVAESWLVDGNMRYHLCLREPTLKQSEEIHKALMWNNSNCSNCGRKWCSWRTSSITIMIRKYFLGPLIRRAFIPFMYMLYAAAALMLFNLNLRCVGSVMEMLLQEVRLIRTAVMTFT